MSMAVARPTYKNPSTFNTGLKDIKQNSSRNPLQQAAQLPNEDPPFRRTAFPPVFQWHPAAFPLKFVRHQHENAKIEMFYV